MTAADDEQARRAERSRAVALFRYSLIREAADPGLSTRQRGRLVRELAAREWPSLAILGILLLGFGNGAVVWAEQTVPSGLTAVLVATSPFWMVGFDALMPPVRQVTLRTPDARGAGRRSTPCLSRLPGIGAARFAAAGRYCAVPPGRAPRATAAQAGRARPVTGAAPAMDAPV